MSGSPSPTARLPRWPDLAGYALAILYALPSLAYPYGPDQGLFDYVGRGMLHGDLPYVDSFDQKPPLIYVLYAVGGLLFGPQQWFVRVAELGAILALGALAARVATADRGAPPVVGGGACALAIAAFHYTAFDWWHTAQLEVWAALAMFLSLRRSLAVPTVRGALLAGVFGGLAFMVKFPAGVFALVVGVAAGIGIARREGLLRGGAAILVYGVGATLVILACLVPWLIDGSLATLWDILVGYNRAYLEKKQSLLPAPEFVANYALPYVIAGGVAVLVGAGAALGAKRPHSLVRGALLVTLAGAAVVTVVMQGKFYAYHWSVGVPFAVAATAWGLGEILAAAGTGRRARRLALGLAALLATVGYAWNPPWGHHLGWSYPTHVASTWNLVTGQISRGTFLQPFRFRADKEFGMADVERVGRYIRERARPGDTLYVHAFEPALYNLTDLRCPSRFEVQFPFEEKRVAYKKEEWRREHESKLSEEPPTFWVVGERNRMERRKLKGWGYVQIARVPRYVLYMREADLDARGATRPTPGEGAVESAPDHGDLDEDERG